MKLIKMNKRSDVGVNTTSMPCEAYCRADAYASPGAQAELQQQRYYEVRNGGGSNTPYSIEEPKSNL